MTRIAINGFGRIGRCLVRAIHERGLQDSLQLVAINDPVSPEMLAHLLRHDTTHGRFRVPVTQQDDMLQIGDSAPVRCLAETDPAALPWQAMQVDLVLECSGRLKSAAKLAGHRQAGARRVLAAYPVSDADAMVVYGVNHDTLHSDHTLISNASCTTNCLAPLVKVLDDAFGLVSGQMTTIHAYTNDQNLIDKAHGDLYRARAAAVNMIPTRTGAAGAVGKVLPHLDGRLDGMAVRVPLLNVSLVDLHCVLQKPADRDAINATLRHAAEGALKGILAVNDEPLVSSDFNQDPHSSIADLTQTRVIGDQVKVIAWYDNEWGFTQRMLDVALHLAQLDQKNGL
ncbi:type I glyceraldehyde-3-phosphate dehydrogenase [Isoalcanivorax indicus]|uniref:type I glyceraldehyde-3-phosphate dehydrogenase n=1 Tax=Isoalcanivorax indicus TaxID=2202653 RepID=UPI000DBA4BF2|nr:type I glyceraldehyde-3-phosphate dehydrogenase [Isoalcanivorax indicus]